MLTALSMGWGVQSFTLVSMSALGHLPKLDLPDFEYTPKYLSYLSDAECDSGYCHT